ncbi:hypothetical protein ACFQH2_18715 [Natronoarchaeum sp. GCM10025703]|uniref:hypothetical protein n=1 Tax=Natronoarchaeum sp. GCM10025703 TaxID=3252685 RepID=UPI00361A9B6B
MRDDPDPVGDVVLLAVDRLVGAVEPVPLVPPAVVLDGDQKAGRLDNTVTAGVRPDAVAKRRQPGARDRGDVARVDVGVPVVGIAARGTAPSTSAS